ncbi:MAG: type I-U CRISPR-associated RAMP protein Csb1/Cas7u [Propioniciclava sp.]
MTTTLNRILLDVRLEPTLGSRFQPTGFPDLGAADYYVPSSDGTVSDRDHCLLVESAQSMANRLEGTAWDSGTQQQVDLFEGLGYVRVINDAGDYLTSSRTEAHRLASAFVKDSTVAGESMMDVITRRLQLRQDFPLDHRAIARALFQLDPFVLLHGVFFADGKWPGQPKIARAVTSFVEANGVQRAESGGVKRDAVRHAIEDGKGGSSEGYGSVPFARTEWTAEQIHAYFSIDLAQIRSYGLSDEATELLTNIARWEIRTLLDGGLRLRTACDFLPVSAAHTDKAGNELPSADVLAAAIREGIAATASEREGSAVLDAVWNGGGKKSK